MSRTRIALGLFHFNVQYELGASDSYHRYICQSVRPFVDLLSRSPFWKTSVAFSRTCLECLAHHYPRTFDRFSKLVHSKQIELISSLYTPAI